MDVLLEQVRYINGLGAQIECIAKGAVGSLHGFAFMYKSRARIVTAPSFSQAVHTTFHRGGRVISLSAKNECVQTRREKPKKSAKTSAWSVVTVQVLFMITLTPPEHLERSRSFRPGAPEARQQRLL